MLFIYKPTTSIHHTRPYKHISKASTLVFGGTHALAGSHDLVNKQQLLSKGGSNVEPLLLGTIVVIDLLLDGGNCA
jgi:hypothetical protein